jgi:N-acetyl-alpha-D-muramate 1-phosphate uridylyltransferase
MKAMILAAGLGTRLKPFTNHHPKALAMVNGKSLLQRCIEYLQQAGITEVIVNVHHFAQQIIDAIETNNGWGSQVSISDETDEVLETGGGLLKAQHYLQHSPSFVLINADMLSTINLTEMIAKHQSHNSLATLAIADRSSSRHLLFTPNNILGGWQNNKTQEQKIINTTEALQPYAFSGIHVINSKLFALIQRTGKFSMIDAYLDVCGLHTIQGYIHPADAVMDVGKPESLELAQKLFLGRP